MTSLTEHEREWVAQTIADVLTPLGMEFDAERGGKLLESRLAVMLDRARCESYAAGFKAGHLAGYNLAEQAAAWPPECTCGHPHDPNEACAPECGCRP